MEPFQKPRRTQIGNKYDHATFNILRYHSVLIVRSHHGNRNIADARQPDDWTIMRFIKQAEFGRFEMFNLKKDPAETTNHTNAETERFTELRERMIQLHTEIRAEGPEYELKSKKKSKGSNKPKTNSPQN